MSSKILVVDDEVNISELVRFNLTREGYQVSTAATGQQCLELAEQQSPDLILLDLMLPGMDGLEVCRNLRKNTLTENIPIIMLTARGEELDKVLGLEMGADDYITKPFSPRELVARVKAHLRRRTREKSVGEEGKQLVQGAISVDLESYEVFVQGKKQDFTPKEFEVLRLLMANPGRVFTRDYLLEKVWGYDYLGDSRTVDVHIRHIRQKVEQEDGNPQYIETVRGVGYRFRQSQQIVD